MTSIGFDLGTTNTVAAVQSRVQPIAIEEGSALLPSAVAFPPSGSILVGTRARRRRAIDAKNTVVASKRLIGRRFHSDEVEEFQRRYTLELMEDSDGELVFKTRGGFLSPTEIAAIVLRTVLDSAPVEPSGANAAIAVPSRFGEAERKATREAARQAGFDNLTIIDEPVATAMAYLHGDVPNWRYAAVYDLGGGTFDMAIIDCQTRPFRVLAHGGDLYLGGDDIDLAVAKWAAEEIAREHRWDLRDDPIVFDRLVLECERAKVRLGRTKSTRIELSQIDPAAPAATAHLVLDVKMLENLALDLVYRSFVVCDAVVAEAGIKAMDVDAVFLAGGTTLLPMVRDSVHRYFERKPLSDYDPMEVVSIGASIAAAAAR